MADIGILCSFAFLVFGIGGVQIFSGRFRYRCFVDGVNTGSLCDRDVGCEGVCKYVGYNPEPGVIAYDNFLQSCLAIFQVITLENWSHILEDSVNTSSKWSIIFYIFVVFLGAYFLLNLVNAVMCSMYKKEHALLQNDMVAFAEIVKETDKKFLAEHKSQTIAFDIPWHIRIYYKSYKALGSLFSWVTKPCFPITRRLRPYFENWYHAQWFKNLMTSAIVLNVVLLAAFFYNQPNWWGDFLDYSNLIFTVIFTLEMIVVWTIEGTMQYFHSWFNVTDVFVVFGSWIEIAIALVLGIYGLSSVTSSKDSAVFETFQAVA